MKLDPSHYKRKGILNSLNFTMLPYYYLSTGSFALNFKSSHLESFMPLSAQQCNEKRRFKRILRLLRRDKNWKINVY